MHDVHCHPGLTINTACLQLVPLLLKPCACRGITAETMPVTLWIAFACANAIPFVVNEAGRAVFGGVF